MNFSKLLKPLDTWRGIAALQIALFLHWHDNIDRGFTYLSHEYLDGRVLVELFFILSGLAFTAFYMKRISNDEVSVSDFIYSRFTRLAPLHWGTLFFTCFLLVIRHMMHIPPFVYPYNDIHHFILNLLMIQADGLQVNANFNAVSWTICIEILLYIIFFLCCKKIKTKHAYIFICWFLILIGFSLERSDTKSTFTLFNISIGRGMISFFVGSLLYFFIAFLSTVSPKKQNIFTYLCLLLLVFLCLVIKKVGLKILSHNDWYFMLTTFNFIIYPIVIIISVFNVPTRKFLLFPPLQFLGKISFTIYMCHYPVQLLIDTITKTSPFKSEMKDYWFFYCTFVLLFSILVHYFYEKPIVLWLKNNKSKFWKDASLKTL